jgi:hypothetical protein
MRHIVEKQDNVNDRRNAEYPRDAADVPASSRRRKLLRGGLIGAPAVLALHATPVRASNCKLPSGFSVSGNQSRPDQYACTTLYKPAQWPERVVSGKYSGTSVAPNDLFKTYFTSDPTTAKIRDVLTEASVRSKATAVLLNAASNQLSGLSVQMAKDMYNLGVKGSGYPAAAGVTWNAATVEAYYNYILGL